MTKETNDYWYRHTGGGLTRKQQIVVDMGGGPSKYFNSPFVKHWWFGQQEDEPKTIEVKEAP